MFLICLLTAVMQVHLTAYDILNIKWNKKLPTEYILENLDMTSYGFKKFKGKKVFEKIFGKPSINLQI